jgi:parallel beta-helix repeat protein
VALVLPLTVQPASAAATLVPIADSWVDSSQPTVNNGTKTTLRVDASPTLVSYLKFDIPAGTVSPATLRIFAVSNHSLGFSVRSVADDSWTETGITNANAPAYGAIAASSGGLTAGTWVEVNVTSLVTGSGQLSLALTTTSSTAMSLASRESGGNAPQLVLGSAPNPAGYLVSRDGATYQAVSQPAGTSYSGTLKSVVEAAVIDLNQGGGGTVTFGAGIFDYGSGFFDVDQIHNITFQGQGIDVTFLQNSSSAAADTEPFNFSGAFNVVIRDMTISAGGPPRTTSDVIDFDQGNDSLVERVKITASRGRGIIFDGKDGGWTAEGNVVRDCIISGVPGDAIELLAAGNNLIENCTITNTGFHGIQITKSSTSAPQPNKKSNDNIVRNNTIDNSGQDGINLNSGDRNQIIGNTITNSSNITGSRDGIRLSSSNLIPCDDNVVNGNLATDNQPTKTQSYGLNISSSLCNRTVVGATNNFAGNRLGPIRDVGTGTIYAPPPGDTQPPTAPTNLVATAGGPDRISLTWQAATDNVGVTAYDIYRGASLAGSVGGTTLTYLDTGLSPSTTYSYTVKARDAAGLSSPASNVASATTAPAPSSLTLVPIADSWVDSSQPTVNNGTKTTLRVDGSPTLVSYLKFDIPADTVSSATLRIFANSNHSLGFSVRSVVDDSWTETGIIYGNAPAYGAVAASSGGLTAGTWVNVDVTSLVTGSGQLSLALTTTSSTAMSLASRESGGNAPQLVLGY